MNRRTFLGVAAGLTLADAGAQTPPSIPIIDTHIHLFDPSRPGGVPWPSANNPAHKVMYMPSLPSRYRKVVDGLGIVGAIEIECSPLLEDNQWVLDLAVHEPFIVGFVGNLPVGSEGFAGHLKRFTANRLFRGIRLRDRKLEGTLDDPAFVSDLKLLADHDLSLDLVGGTEILPFAYRLAEEVTPLRIIIDHLAGVVVDGKAPSAGWVEKMKALARRPKVFFKLSGLVEGTGRSDGTAPRDEEFYRPVLNSMREMFGPDRLIYASNWPVSERFAPLATVQGIVGDYFRRHGRRAEEQVFSQSAKVAYKWIARK